MLLKIFPDHLSEQKLQTAVNTLRDGGVIVFPTDTVYAFGCDLMSKKGIEKLIKLSGKRRPDFSFVCHDISQAMQYTATLDQPVFREMKRVFPGAFTIIVKASPQVTRLFGTNKKTVGIRIPDNEIARSLAQALGNPLLSTSLHDEDVILDYMTDPKRIEEKMRGKVDLVVDGGSGGNQPSTVVDFTEGDATIVRQGVGVW
ncbi:MAG: threonylcarbamoyl-AMP synthase [Chitinophagales bacterium]|nr:threonylcarbamoyl-AMP synthase [Chitinophagales bacterium]